MVQSKLDSLSVTFITSHHVGILHTEETNATLIGFDNMVPSSGTFFLRTAFSRDLSCSFLSAYFSGKAVKLILYQ